MATRMGASEMTTEFPAVYKEERELATRMTPIMATRMVASEMTPEFSATCGTVKRSGDENDAHNTENGDKSCLRTYMRTGVTQLNSRPRYVLKSKLR